MKHYYNEFDPFAAAWLRELMKAGHIPKGDVDERSIREVRADDLVGYTQCHFFAGIGGWPLALRLAGWPEDRRVWTGSCPCQPFSVIGKHGRTDDERHLWPEFLRLITPHRPPDCLGEQVASKDGREWLAGVRSDLEALGYAFGGADLCAACVGAPHVRQRLYWVGNALGEGSQGHAGDGCGGDQPGRLSTHPGRPDPAAGESVSHRTSLDEMSLLRRLSLHDSRVSCGGLRLSSDRGVGDGPVWAEFDALPCRDGWRRVQPGTFPLAHGVPARVGRLRGYGNAIVPQAAAEFVKAYLEVTEGE